MAEVQLARYSVAQRVALAIVPRVAALLIRALGTTLRYEDVLGRGAVRGDLIPGPSVYAFWHRSLLLAAHRFRHLGIAILISRSFDGELIARTVERLGFVAVRGSSSRGGSTGLRKLELAYEQGRRCAITADGPKGPAMQAKPGAAQLAHLVETTWVGTFYVLPQRAWVLKTWDRFLIPRPFSRVIVAWPLYTPPTEDRIQKALEQAVALAEAAIGPR